MDNKSKNNIDSQLKGNQLLTYTRQLFEIIDEDIWKAENHDQEPDRFYYTIIYKLFSLLDAASFLVCNIDTKPHYVDSLFISLRACMLDCICLLFVVDKHENTDVARENIDRIMADHIKAFYKDASNEAQKKQIRMKFPQFFDGEKIKNDKGITVKFMVNDITHDTLKKEAQRALYLYTIFSKLEHNGFFTFDILHGHHIESGKQKFKELIVNAIGVPVVVLSLILKNWLSPTNERYLRLEELTRSILHRHDPNS